MPILNTGNMTYLSSCPIAWGPRDDFMSTRFISVWNRHGELLAQLNIIDRD